MKRSTQVRLVLLGGVAAVVLPGCGDKEGAQFPAAAPVYANNDHPPGYGYYHAPYRAWFSQPYNFRDPKTGLYFHGGNWTAQPCQSIINVSDPKPEELRALDTHISRGGFGSSSSGHYFSS